MTITTKRMVLYALTPELMKTAITDLPAALDALGLRIGSPEPDELQMRRHVYKLKLEIMERFPNDLQFCTSWQMALKARGIVVGELGFKGPAVNGELEIGYGTDLRYRNRGYMKEAVAALCAYGLSTPGVKAINALTGPENYASQSVLTACGFRPVERDGKHLRFKLTGGT